MIYATPNPIGIDEAINVLQKKLHDGLNTLWGIELHAYGRVCKNYDKGRIIPEIYKGDKEYSGSLLYAEKSKFFFDVDAKYKNIYGDKYEAFTDIIFLLDLSEITADRSVRIDEKVKQDVTNFIRNFSPQETLDIESGVDNVLSSFIRNLPEDKKYDDREPYHLFKVKKRIEFFYQNINC